MDLFILYTSLGIALLMFLAMYRAVSGPTTLDRLLGVNAVGSKTTVLIVLIGFIFQRVDMFVDIALAYAMLNFISVLAAARYFYKRGLAEDESGIEGGRP
ncbi:multiple resistance and pH regulation protein F [Desulfovibrio sp. X2]|uniref:monovalent cation/H+ antiporter complex subunit F n=1 Tax=Desulfovibrio sp. X2 TaxID=941449 RepID=UPI0003589F11|nr:monovalent cation/H+ antiporter complex subunit F [Desulfovibrio sp. X2]EPR36323.1 multiple resistance and pH regulation protein F [Desulfovibrio sp. X2]